MNARVSDGNNAAIIVQPYFIDAKRNRFIKADMHWRIMAKDGKPISSDKVVEAAGQLIYVEFFDPFRGESGTDSGICRIIRPDGTTEWVGVLIPCDGSGRFYTATFPTFLALVQRIEKALNDGSALPRVIEL